MAAQIELFSKIGRGAVDFAWKRKVPTVIVAGLLSLTYAASFLSESRTVSLPPTPQPTPGLDGCVSIGGLPEGRHTTYSALMELSARSGWPFPSDEMVYIRHRLGDQDEPISVQDALARDKIIFDADAWCLFEP